MSSPKKSLMNAITDDFLSVLTKRFLPVLVDYLNERKSEHKITIEELAKVLQLPAPLVRESNESRSENKPSQSKKYPPPVATTSLPGRGGRRGGGKKVISPDRQCLYIPTR